MPKLDYVPRLDERNKAYRVGAVADLSARSIYWTPGTVLDQGQEGSCVGHGVVGEYLASPVRGRVSSAAAGHVLAVSVYDRARQVDEFEGDTTEGTSVRAGMLVARERGWCTGFNWALNMAELRTALEQGPVVIGVDWYESMYEPVGRDLVVRGKVAGGHCLLVTGYQASVKSYRLLNSWSPSWGLRGQAYITDTDLKRVLFDAGGEAAVPIGRRL